MSANAGRKGYVGSLDLILAMLLFLVVVYMVFWANAEAADKIPSYEKSQAYKEKALNVTDVLLKTPGDPADWETLADLNQTESIGFVKEANVLDRSKLLRFGDIPEQQARRMLGLTREKYRIEVLESGKNRDRVRYSFGSATSPIASIERLAILDGEAVKFRVSLS